MPHTSDPVSKHTFSLNVAVSILNYYDKCDDKRTI